MLIHRIVGVATASARVLVGSGSLQVISTRALTRAAMATYSRAPWSSAPRRMDPTRSTGLIGVRVLPAVFTSSLARYSTSKATGHRQKRVVDLLFWVALGGLAMYGLRSGIEPSDALLDSSDGTVRYLLDHMSPLLPGSPVLYPGEWNTTSLVLSLNVRSCVYAGVPPDTDRADDVVAVRYRHSWSLGWQLESVMVRFGRDTVVGYVCPEAPNGILMIYNPEPPIDFGYEPPH